MYVYFYFIIVLYLFKRLQYFNEISTENEFKGKAKVFMNLDEPTGDNKLFTSDDFEK